MSELELWAVTAAGPVPLSAVAERAPRDLHELFDGFAPGVYSGLRTYGHDRFLGLEHHLERTERSAALLGWSERLDDLLLRRSLHALVSAHRSADARVRFDWLAAPVTAPDGESRLLVGLAPLLPIAPELLERGVLLGLCPLRRPAPLIKTTDFVRRRRACSELDPVAYEHLLVSEDGLVLEGTSSNFFGVRAGRLVTAGTGVLEGVTRRIVLELAGPLGLDTSFDGIRVDALASLDEAFICSSTREIVPAVQIGTRGIGTGCPGPVTQALHAAFRRFAAASARPAIVEPLAERGAA
jgi:branched-chain amino acid aminotransferase